jgi:hypothetical protein
MIVKSTFQPLNRRGFIRGSAALGLLAGLHRIMPAYAFETLSENDVPSRAENPLDPAKIGKQHAIVGGRNTQPTRAHVETRQKRLKEARQKRLKEGGKAAGRKQAPERPPGVPAPEAPR